MIGDLGMTEGLEHDTIIRVGFLNHDGEGALKKFSESFDIVILNDGTMDYVNELLKKVLS